MPVLATAAMAELSEPPVTFEDCYQRHRNEVYRLGLRYGGGRQSWAEDLTHDVFVKLLEHFQRLENVADLGGWLYTITARLAISRLRREQSWFGRLHRVPVAHQQDLPADDLLARHEAASAAVEVMRLLPARERVVLYMKLLDGQSQKHIAEALSMSEGYVSKLLARAWGQIRAAGWEVDDVDA
jgi:RNA polymerase sigma factor (sigma-70 family)